MRDQPQQGHPPASQVGMLSPEQLAVVSGAGAIVKPPGPIFGIYEDN